MAKPTPKTVKKKRKLEGAFQPVDSAVKRVFDYLAGINKGASEEQLRRTATAYARAVGIFAQCQDPSIGDIHINADLEHECRMEPVREMRKMAQRMKELLDHQDIKNTYLGNESISEAVGIIMRASSLVEGALDNTHAHFRQSSDKRDGDPMRSRYRLYVELAGCWYTCKERREIPARKREGGGEFADFAEGLLKLFPDTARHVSVDEMHKALLGMIKRERSTTTPLRISSPIAGLPAGQAGVGEKDI